MFWTCIVTHWSIQLCRNGKLFSPPLYGWKLNLVRWHRGVISLPVQQPLSCTVPVKGITGTLRTESNSPISVQQLAAPHMQFKSSRCFWVGLREACKYGKLGGWGGGTQTHVCQGAAAWYWLFSLGPMGWPIHTCAQWLLSLLHLLQATWTLALLDCAAAGIPALKHGLFGWNTQITAKANARAKRETGGAVRRGNTAEQEGSESA